MDLGQKLLQLRKKLNLSQEYVADEIGVTKTTLRKWESNKSTPTIENLKKLSEFYQVSILYWFDKKLSTEENDFLTQLKNLIEVGQKLYFEMKKSTP